VNETITSYVGLDVHKETIPLALADLGHAKCGLSGMASASSLAVGAYRHRRFL
jgi:hypothetical protein